MTPPFNLCDPAFYYLLLSLVIISVIAIQNYGQGFNYCVGMQSCPSSNTVMIFVVKILYVLAWTCVLNLLCNNGYKTISWVLVLFPIVLMFIFMALLISNQFDITKYFVFPNLFN